MERKPDSDSAERPPYEMIAIGVRGETNEDGTLKGILELHTSEGVAEFTIASPECAELMITGLQTYLDRANSRLAEMQGTPPKHVKSLM